MPRLPSRITGSTRDRVSLLSEQSPPPSPSPFRTSNENVSSVFPSAHVVTGAKESFEDMRKRTKQQKPYQAEKPFSPTETYRLPSKSSKNSASGIHSQQHRDFAVTHRTHQEMTAITGALQFVPAYTEATSRPFMSLERSSQPVSPSDSYDGEQQQLRSRPLQQQGSGSAIPGTSSNPQEPERGIFRRKNGKTTNTPSTVSSNMHTSGTPAKPIMNKRCTPSKPVGTPNNEDAVSAVSSSRGRGTTRIARLAFMFASRAVVKNLADTPTTAEPSPSPPSQPHSKGAASPSRSSDASSGYVGWPGTQDKRGGTVAIQSSYEESDGGAPHLSRKKYHEELEAKVDRELTRWLDESQPSDGSDPVSPAHPSPNHRPITNKFIKHNPNDSTNTGGSDEEGNPADFHLAAAVANAAAAAASPMAPKNNSLFQSSGMKPRQAPQPKPQQHTAASRLGSGGRLSTPLNSRIASVNDIYGHDNRTDELHLEHKWGVNTSGDNMSSAGTSVSKTSSAYFSATNPSLLRNLTTTKGGDSYAVNRDRQAILRMKSAAPQPPTEEMLALNDSFSPPLRTFNAAGTIGYRGLLDKTKDVPNLMDDVESDSTTSRATSVSSAGRSSANHSMARRSSRQYTARGIDRLRTSDELDEQVVEDASSGDVFDRMDKSTESNLGDLSIPESDVFDGLSNIGSTLHNASRGGGPGPSMGKRGGSRDPYRNMGMSIPSEDAACLNLVLLGGGLTTIQTSMNDFSKRITPDEFDETLTNSDYDQYGYAKIPGFNKMAALGRSGGDKSIQSDDSILLISKDSRQTLRPFPAEQIQSHRPNHRSVSRAMDKSGITGSDSGSSLFSDPYPKEAWGHNVHSDLSVYYVHPDEMKKVLQVFRRLSSSRTAQMSYDELEQKEDATKAFALSEMRSRIMEKDIERGLERRGGTTVVDDLALTPHHRASLRIRDAIVVSKAWRDGASPRDVINTSLLTRRAERAFFIKRPISHGRSPRWANIPSGSSGASECMMAPRYTWEEVRWVDDTDFVQYRCPSLGPRHMRGFEMFTVGDCQSILLKLSNERCLELRAELNDATARQIEAEEIMKEDADPSDGMMTEAEMTYLTTMEEVKTISHKLVIAEKAFTLVRDRIENLVSKYESLLVKMTSETESMAASSLISYQSSYYSDDSYSSDDDDREKEVLARRAQRAELRAEMAAREAMLAKQEARTLRYEKERELQALQMRLNELQSESSAAINEKEQAASIVLARAIKATRAATPNAARPVGGRVDRTKLEDVKRRFRDRTAAKMRGGSTSSGSEAAPRYGASPSTMTSSGNPQLRMRQDAPRSSHDNVRNTVYRTVGEEMFQHLDFYERSLKAVDGTR